MDGFSYTNIFETKGIEYLAIVLFFATLIPFWILLNKQVKLSSQIQKSLGALSLTALRIPQGVFFSKHHTWTFLEKSGLAKVGLDDLILHITGSVKFENLKNPGDKIAKGDLLAEINQNGKYLKIYAPLSGDIVETNTRLNDHPEILIQDLYSKGWIYKIKPSNWFADTNNCYMAEEATKWSAVELVRFKDFLADSVGKHSDMYAQIILQDGGELQDQPLVSMPEEVWQDFQDSFLRKPTKYPRFRGLGNHSYDSEYFTE